ncbi:MAG: AarF/ABC1/UbiB kinase family protein [Verrucomicrobiae bacterium]|nr:AarF/ABC1/UbiB kinase family protein [Verrucomicrobiae bacterium]
MVLKQIRTAVEVYSHLPRYREIFSVFLKYGFGDMLNIISLQKMLGFKEGTLPKEEQQVANKGPAVRFRMALEELGPTFVKFGQILSTRRDLVDEVLVKELRKLQDQVIPFSSAEARKIIEQETECEIGELFKEFDEKPVASASMAQVHKAVLHNGETVAIKCQRPDISQLIQVDLAIMMDIAKLIEKNAENLATLNPTGIVKELSKTIWAEQDFTTEARNMERFAKQFQGNKTIRVAFVYPEFTTQRILVMEFIQGWRIDQPAELRAHGVDPVRLSRRATRLIYQQMFDHGFFHADPHPGNMAVLENGVICLYDYGMMGTLTSDFRENIANLVLGLDKKDQRMVTRALLGMSESGYVDDMRRLEIDVQVFCENYLTGPLKDLNLGYVLNRLLDVLMQHHIRMLSDFYLGIKALSQVEDIGRTLNPDLNFVKMGEPYARAVLERKYDVNRFLKNLYFSFAEGLQLLQDLPIEFKDWYNRVKTGEYNIPLQHHIDPAGFDPMRNTLNRIANRVSNALVLSSLFISAAILFLANQETLGWVTFIGALVMASRLALAIWKRSGF